VSWKAPANDGGSPIVGYAVIPNGRDDLAVLTNGTETTATVTGLTNGTSYTFTVVAFNGAELASAVSVPSNAVTPVAAPTAVTPVVAAPSAVVPVGAPNTGAGGASSSSNGPLAGLGGLALLLAGAGATQVIRRRRQV
jgi:serine protease